VNLTRSRDRNTLHIRLFKLAVKTARYCLNHAALEYALKVLERCSEYVSAFEARLAPPVIRVDHQEQGDLTKVPQRLVAEFWLLRVLCCFKQNRPDIAQAHYAKIDENVLTENAEVTQMAAEICHQGGQHLARRGNLEDGARWLELSNTLLNGENAADLDPITEDLRLLVVADFIELLVHGSSQDRLEDAWRMTVELGSMHGLDDRLAVLKMQLSLATRCKDAGERVAGILLRMVKTTVLTEDTFCT
jgi:hypothetical protein